MDYISYVTGVHDLYNRYLEDWKLCINSYYGGTEYKNARYLRAYAGDFNTPGETLTTYDIAPDGAVVAKFNAKVTHGSSANNVDKDNQLVSGSFYGEKLDNTPLYNYVKLIVAEYNSILFRNPPQRVLPDMPEVGQFLRDVDGEGNNINEFMSQVDMFTTIYGVCHVACYKPLGSSVPKWKIHSPLDVTNWSYRYLSDGTLALNDIVIQLEKCEDYSVYRNITPEYLDTVFVGNDDEYYPAVAEGTELEVLSDNVYRVRQINELAYIPVTTLYQSTKVYNNVGTTVVQDVAQIQRSIYGDMAEIYSAITYGAHPVTIVDETTDQLNDGQIGSEPGSIIRVQNSLGAEANYVYEFVSPSLDAISEIRELVDNKVGKLLQIAMLRSEDLIRASNSGEQIQQYDDKLAGLIRRKSTNLENAEAKLWSVWADWLNIQLPEQFAVSYNRQYNKRALEHELAELEKIMSVYSEYTERFSAGVESSLDTAEFNEDIRSRIKSRLTQLLGSTSTENGL